MNGSTLTTPNGHIGVELWKRATDFDRSNLFANFRRLLVRTVFKERILTREHLRMILGLSTAINKPFKVFTMIKSQWILNRAV